jgi:hypothetical protein
MNWYFALGAASIGREGHDWLNLVRVAVQSARTHTTLVPHLLYDGEASDFTREMQMQGVKVIFHRVTFFDSLAKHGERDPNYLSIASGAFLRFDIPVIERVAKYVLYTDCDVMFRRDPDFFESGAPSLFSATSQTSDIPSEDMNSGVMLINVPAMRELHADLVNFTRVNLDLGLDQEILRVFFDGKYTPMDRSLNWKPYWGINPAAQIVHFHGPKPIASQRLTAETLANATVGWQTLFSRHPFGYLDYSRQWEALLNTYNNTIVSAPRNDQIDVLLQQLEQMTADRDRWRGIAEGVRSSDP